ncbi:MAG: hypothetical protein KY455_07510 [Euryarchaeota archaeon]|nr:hypothetical protein [Euryarchaeota archaeon]
MVVVPGAISEGDTEEEEEAVTNVTEAIGLILDVRMENARNRHALMHTVDIGVAA